MEAISPLTAALGVVEHDALNDLARWLDGRFGPFGTAEQSDRRSGGSDLRASARPAGKGA
jgi:hypothetical protein